MTRPGNWGQEIGDRPRFRGFEKVVCPQFPRNRGLSPITSVPNYVQTVVCPRFPRNRGLSPISRGFTLFELLVVMALLGVATLLATGVAEPLVRAARERNWIDRLHAELIRTRSYARASGAVAVVSFVPEQQEIRFVTGPRTRLLALPEGFRFGSRFETADGDEVRTMVFFPDGTASDLELMVTGSAGRTTRLRVTGITGKIELTPWETSEEPPA